MLSIDINDAAQAVLMIPDADGELHAYRFALAPRGLSLWAMTVTRADSGATYLVREESAGSWSCACEAQKYRKRGAPNCKHCAAAKLLRSWLNDFLAQPKPKREELPNGTEHRPAIAS